MNARRVGSGSAVDRLGAGFQFYASLPDPERSYRAVADEFAVSVRTVEKHGRAGQWKDRLARVRAEAAEQADAALAQQRAEKLRETELLIDAAMTSFAQQLRAGSVRVSPADVTRLFKLRDELWTQIDHDASLGRATSVAEEENGEGEVDPELRRREIVRALDEAGVFERLRNLIRRRGRALNELPRPGELELLLSLLGPLRTRNCPLQPSAAAGGVPAAAGQGGVLRGRGRRREESSRC